MALVETDGGAFLVTYCTNVHPAESVAGIEEALAAVTAPVARATFGARPMGAGLWLSRAVLDEFAADAARLDRFRARVRDLGLFAFTLNAFPYGGFHAGRVKERVFAPAWTDPRRADYTIACADALDALLADAPPGTTGSISTMPVALRAGFDDASLDRAAAGFARVGRHLRDHEQRAGRTIVLGIEPEPCARLETVGEAIDFLETRVLRGADAALRPWLGVCLDACHEAVMHRDPVDALARLDAAGITLAKVQVTAALAVEDAARNRAALARLAAFDEGRWFHQVGVKDASGSFALHGDLAPFLARHAADPRGLADVRVHFHVPVCAAPEAGLATTADDAARLLAALRRRNRRGPHGAPLHLEVETYTFDAIPQTERAALSADSLAQALSAELRWVVERLR